MRTRYPPVAVALGGLLVAVSGLAGWPIDAIVGVSTPVFLLAVAAVFVAVAAAGWSETLDPRPFAMTAAVVALLGIAVGSYGYAEVLAIETAGFLDELQALLPPVVAIAGGGVALIGAAGAWFDIDSAGFSSRLRGTLVLLGVGMGGIVAMFVWSQVLLILLVALTETMDLPLDQRLIVSNVSLGLGMATGAFLYLLLADRSWSYIDLRMPSLIDVAWMVVGVGGLLAALIGLGVLLELLNAPGAEHGLIEDIVEEGDPEMLLYILIPASLLIIGPGEELLFRNIIQKSLYQYFSRPAAIVVASLVFALAHIPAYWAGAETVTAVIVITVLSLILGAIYARTENIVVPAVVHGLYNAILFAVLYAEMTMDTEALWLLAAGTSW